MSWLKIWPMLISIGIGGQVCPKRFNLTDNCKQNLGALVERRLKGSSFKSMGNPVLISS